MPEGSKEVSSATYLKLGGTRGDARIKISRSSYEGLEGRSSRILIRQSKN